jgi:hypothetical protein
MGSSGSHETVTASLSGSWIAAAVLGPLLVTGLMLIGCWYVVIRRKYSNGGSRWSLTGRRGEDRGLSVDLLSGTQLGERIMAADVTVP